MVFLIFVRIVLYRRRKSGHHLGTKAVKIIVILSVLIYKKLSIFKAFHSSRPFNTTKTNTIFYLQLQIRIAPFSQYGRSFPKWNNIARNRSDPIDDADMNEKANDEQYNGNRFVPSNFTDFFPIIPECPYFRRKK